MKHAVRKRKRNFELEILERVYEILYELDQMFLGGGDCTGKLVASWYMYS
jgi:hypothetical protein